MRKQQKAKSVSDASVFQKQRKNLFEDCGTQKYIKQLNDFMGKVNSDIKSNLTQKSLQYNFDFQKEIPIKLKFNQIFQWSKNIKQHSIRPISQHLTLNEILDDKLEISKSKSNFIREPEQNNLRKFSTFREEHQEKEVQERSINYQSEMFYSQKEKQNKQTVIQDKFE